MLNCWHSEPEARLNFTQLKYSFQSTITNNNAGISYITIQPDCCDIATEDEPLSCRDSNMEAHGHLQLQVNLN